MSKAFNIMALDADFGIVSLLRYTNLQWNRKFHEPGNFSLEIPLEQYSSSYAYIYTTDRPELGVINQVNYIDRKDYKCMAISGYFLENELNKRVAFPACTSNIVNAPTWVNKSGVAETVAFAYFEAFKDLTFIQNEQTFSCTLGITAGTDKKRGKNSNHERQGELLGSKIYTILKPSSMSYRVAYDFITSKKVFSCWTGVDRSQGNTDGNNPVIFSSKNGTVKSPNILQSDENYKNICISINKAAEGETETIYGRAYLNDEALTGDWRATFLNSTINKSDYSSDDNFFAALKAEQVSTLNNCDRTINVEFDAVGNSYDYRTDFELGDKCSLEFPEVDISFDAILIGCYEVVKSAEWSLTLEFGTPIY